MNVAIVGAGLAGLAAACELSGLGHRVTLFEKRPWCGGKTYSFTDRETGEEVDNGQHVFMGCTTEYTAFLRRLGTIGLARRQRRLSVSVYDAHGRRARLRSRWLPAPLHLGLSFALYRHLSLRDRLSVGRLLLRVWRLHEARRATLCGLSFGQWLRDHGQSEAAIRDFWDFVLVPTLNCRSGDASAADALFVLREGFLKDSTSAAIGLPGVGLSKLHVEPALAQLQRRGGEVRTGAEVTRFVTGRGMVSAVELKDGSHEAFDAFICAAPHTKVAALFDPGAGAPFRRLADIPTAPIINLHFWFDRSVADFPFAAFIGSELQWVFNRDRLDITPEPRAVASVPRPPSGNHLSSGAAETATRKHHVVVSLSAAGPYMDLDRRQLEERFLPQLRAALPLAAGAALLKFQAIKEPEATFVPAPGIRRPPNATHFANLYLAGAYTDTGWPATMESAVRSGLNAARALHVHCVTSKEAAISGGQRR